ncbi:DUF1302 family protein [Fontimonas sp. SYSU GA230001]|uniref:DUF1302 domain-containing protein n=1 Tax=Fontimonas sp. SYSU GA230001 TaxID=3142450 RepID=UPI0032B3A4E2
MNRRTWAVWFAAGWASLCAQPVQALTFELPAWSGQPFEGVLNTTLTAGAAWRMESRADDLVGKSNLDPDLCGRENGRLRWQGCQGLFRDQVFTAERLVSAPGQFSMNGDDGNLNYDRHDLTQAPLKLTSDLTLGLGNFGLFVRGLYFHDFVNRRFTEFHPNEINSANALDVANVSLPGTEVISDPADLLGLPIDVLALIPGAALPVGTVPVGLVRVDSKPCPPQRNPDDQPCGLVYSRGGPVQAKRRDRETLRQIGADFQLLDALFYGSFQLPGERELTVKLGRQLVSWGESTVLVFDSINQANPADANNLLRVGAQIEEVFTPVAMAFASATVLDSTTLEGFYQLEWQPSVAPAPGSFYSFADIGTNDAGRDVLTLGFGSLPDDPERLGYLIDNPLSGTTNTSIGFVRERDREPGWKGQYGIGLKYYAEWLNSGTEFGLFFMHYHSRLPFVSVFSVPEACGKHATDTVSFTQACIDVPLYHALTAPNDPEGATDAAIDFDAIRVQLEYPRNIRMFGLSFNTTFGDFALQGEVAYRPDAPMQVDLEDLAFAAYGPSATNCHLPQTGCSGSGIIPNAAKLPDGSNTLDSGQFYAASDFVVDASGTPGAFNDTFDLFYGHAAGAGRYFPSFIVPYRGGTLGLNPPNAYIRGWETFDSYQFNLGGTYLMGATEWVSRLLFADQVIWLFESGATWVPGLPALDELQLEAPGTYLHASAGADGSGAYWTDAAAQRQACSTNIACSYGPDGIRFNPHQEDLDLYPDRLSWGYDMIAIISYESVLPGISLRPTILWKHDVKGTAPGLASNFVQGRMLADVNLEIRYKASLSLNLGYNLQAGGGRANLWRDRDTARAFIKYQF